jgi:hypothetical protein
MKPVPIGKSPPCEGAIRASSETGAVRVPVQRQPRRDSSQAVVAQRGVRLGRWM